MTELNHHLARFYAEVEERFGKEGVHECQLEDDVQIEIVYHRFVSRSKGWRNGKKRNRREEKEIRLIKYGGGLHTVASFSL